MNIVNIYHKSRDVIYELNFQANGETAWSFTAEGDGQIYDIEYDNIDSFTIDGISITLPFNINNGSSYAVQITKLIEGQSAFIRLKARRETEKTITKYVPNFGDKTINRLFVLGESGTVYVFDKSKLTQANYSGNGIFINDPLITTIALPTNSFSYKSYCMPTYINGFLYVFLANTAGSKINDNFYACKIDLNTYTVLDLDGNQNALTNLGKPTGYNGYLYFIPRVHCYDYVNNIIYAAASNKHTTFAIEPFNKKVRSVENIWGFGEFSSNYRFNSYYDPINNLFQTRETGANEIRNPYVIRTGNAHTLSSYVFLYDITRNGIYKFSAYWGRIELYTQNGVKVVTASNYTDQGGYPILTDGKNDIIVINNDGPIIRFQPIWTNQSKFVQDTIVDIHASHTTFRSILMASEDGDLAALVSNSGRVHFFEYDITTPSVFQMYYDLNDTSIASMNIDNYLIFP